MKTILLATAAVALLARPASAADHKPVEWFTYAPGTQTCVHDYTPSQFIAAERFVYHIKPDVIAKMGEDGQVASVKISRPDEFNPVMIQSIYVFRHKIGCDNFADEQKIDTSKYQ